jgi:hypothetical protein
MKDRKEMYRAIRDALIEKDAECAAESPFNLKGRGHEPRVTLSVRLAAIIRGADISHIVLSGYGADNHYPLRVFVAAYFSLLDRFPEAAKLLDELFPTACTDYYKLNIDMGLVNCCSDEDEEGENTSVRSLKAQSNWFGNAENKDQDRFDEEQASLTEKQLNDQVDGLVALYKKKKEEQKAKHEADLKKFESRSVK